MLQADGVAMEREGWLEANDPYYMTGARGSAHYRFSDWLVCLFLLVFGLLLFFMSKELRYSKRMCWCHVERGREAKSIFKPALGYGWWDAAAVFMNILMENP